MSQPRFLLRSDSGARCNLKVEETRVRLAPLWGPNRRWYEDDLCALAFKVLHDKQRGSLVFLRIYSGTLRAQAAVRNVNRNST